MAMTNTHVVQDLDALRELYRAPSALVRGKVKPTLDPVSTEFARRSPFLLVATRGADGRVDVSPRGGPPGFVRVTDDGELVIPDLNGNNLLDTLENVITTGEAGTLFLRPGHDETLRVNGTAVVSVEPELLDWYESSSGTDLRRPKSVIVVTPREVFIHCGKSFRRGGVWDPSTWTAPGDGPDAADILSCQFELPDPAALRSALNEGYAADLAQDRREAEGDRPN